MLYSFKGLSRLVSLVVMFVFFVSSSLYAYPAKLRVPLKGDTDLIEKFNDLENIDNLTKSEEISGLLFRPKYNFEQKKPLDVSIIKTTRSAEEVIALLKKAKSPLSIQGHLRGVDGPGSSLDLPEFQVTLTDKDAKSLKEHPSTPTIASAFTVKIRFELADDPEVIEYVAPDYGITEANPLKFKGEVPLDKNGRTHQANAPAFIFRNIFGLKGIRVICEEVSPVARAGGMESSNVFNTALIAAASMLSGANLSQADIFSLAVKLENDEFAGLTGGQGHICCLLGGAYQHVWLTGERNNTGDLINPYSAVSIPLLTDDSSIKAIEDHTMLVQAGMQYKDGKPQAGRAASLTNNMWTDLLRDRDEIGFPLHKEKLEATAIFTQALKEGDFATASAEVVKYTERRDKITKRWLSLAIGAHEGVAGLPSYAYEYAKKVWDPSHRDYEEYKMVRDMYDEMGNTLKDISLYTLNPISTLVREALKEGIAIMPLGAGGPGANLMAISEKGLAHMKNFFESKGIHEFDENEAKNIIRGTGELKGYLPFKVGKEPLQIAGFEELGLKLPEGPLSVKAPKNDITKVSRGYNYYVRNQEGHDVYVFSDAKGTFEVVPSIGGTVTSWEADVDGKKIQMLRTPPDLDIMKLEKFAYGIPVLAFFSNRITGDSHFAEFEFDGEIHKIPVNWTIDPNAIHGSVYDKEFKVEKTGYLEEYDAIGMVCSFDAKDFPGEIPGIWKDNKITMTYVMKDGQLQVISDYGNYGDKSTITSHATHAWWKTANRRNLIITSKANHVFEAKNCLPDSGRLLDVKETEFGKFKEGGALGETFVDDVFTDFETEKDGSIVNSYIDLDRGTELIVKSKGFPKKVIYAPVDVGDGMPDFFCDEPSTSGTDSFSHQDQADIFTPVTLNPGETFHGEMNVEVTSLAVYNRRNTVTARSKIISVPASEIIGNEGRFMRWLSDQPKDYAVVVIAQDRPEYDDVVKFKDLAWIKIVDLDNKADLAGIPEKMILKGVSTAEINKVLVVFDKEQFNAFNLGSLDSKLDAKLIKAIVQGV